MAEMFAGLQVVADASVPEGYVHLVDADGNVKARLLITRPEARP